MPLRTQFQLLALLLLSAGGGGFYLLARHAGSTAVAYMGMILVFAGLGLALRGGSHILVRRAVGRLQRAINAANFTDVGAQLADWRPGLAALERRRLNKGTILTLDGRFEEAIRLFDSIDRRWLQEDVLPLLLNNLAWALTRTGQGARAVAAARESIEANAAAGDRRPLAADLRASQLGTLGAALTVAGNPGEAVDLLEQALSCGGTRRQQTARAFYLGEALHALGRHDEARSAWKRALDVAPTDDLGMRARERLDAPDPPPYRS